MDEIEPFVRRLCSEEDLSVLTKKMIRKRYQTHFKKDSVSAEEKQKINEVLDVILEELARGNKILIADGSTKECTESPEKGKENLCDCHESSSPSTISSAKTFWHRISHKMPRSELEGSLSGHTRFKQIGLAVRKDQKQQAALGLSDRLDSNKDSGCSSNSFTISTDGSSFYTNPEKKIKGVAKEGGVSGRREGNTHFNLPSRYNMVSDEFQETEVSEDGVCLLSASPEKNGSEKDSTKEHGQMKHAYCQNNPKVSSDSSWSCEHHVSGDETLKGQGNNSTLTEGNFSGNHVGEHKKKQLVVVNLKLAVAAVTSVDSDSVDEQTSKKSCGMKSWPSTAEPSKPDPPRHNRLKAYKERSHGKMSNYLSSVTMLRRKSKVSTKHPQSSEEDVKTPRCVSKSAAQDSDYDASEEYSSVLSSPVYVSTPKIGSSPRLAARKVQIVLMNRLQPGELPSSSSGTENETCLHAAGADGQSSDLNRSAVQRISPFLQSNQKSNIVDSLLTISKKHKKAAAVVHGKRTKNKEIADCAQGSHGDFDLDDLPLLRLRKQHDKQSYVVASCHDRTSSCNSSSNERVVTYRGLDSDEKLEPYKTSKDLKVKNVFESTTSESNAHLSDLYFSPPPVSSKLSARGRALGQRGRRGTGRWCLPTKESLDQSVYSLSVDTTEEEERGGGKLTKIYNERDPWKVRPYRGEVLPQVVVMLEDIRNKRKGKNELSGGRPLHRRGPGSVLKVQIKKSDHGRMVDNRYYSDSDLIIEADSSVCSKSPNSLPQPFTLESKRADFVPTLSPIPQMQEETEECASDASVGEEEWMVSSSSSTDSLSGKTKITLRRKWTSGTKLALGRDGGMCSVGQECSDFRLCSSLPLARTSDVSFAEQPTHVEKSKWRKDNQFLSSDDEDSLEENMSGSSSTLKLASCVNQQSSDGDSDLETSELSNSGESGDENRLPKSPLKLQFKKSVSRKRIRSQSPENKKSDGDTDPETFDLSDENKGEIKLQVPFKKQPQSKKPVSRKRARHSSSNNKQSVTDSSSTTKSQSSEQSEHPYLKRLKMICRKVGIFVRSDLHFAGCKSDKDRIDRLKEALQKAGMKGQPSLSKVDSVNLKKEAADLDPSNIIETTGRPRRHQTGLSWGRMSPSSVEPPARQQFSRIKDLVTESDSD